MSQQSTSSWPLTPLGESSSVNLWKSGGGFCSVFFSFPSRAGNGRERRVTDSTFFFEREGKVENRKQIKYASMLLLKWRILK